MPAVEGLRDSILKNQSGYHDDARTSSLGAARLFAEHKNTAGELRADIETIYAERSTLKGELCLKLTEPLFKQVSPHGYSWMMGTLLLEQAQCENFVGDFSSSDRSAAESRRAAEKFPVLTLRIVGISAGMRQKRGECIAAWKDSQEGLKLYWEGKYPGDRLDQFYAVMLLCARDEGQLYAAEALIRHLLALREGPHSEVTRQTIREGMLHLHLANILLALGRDSEAASQKAIGEKKLHQGSIPQDYVREFLLTTYIEPAELMASHGNSGRAVESLRTAEKDLQGVQDKFIWVSFYACLGKAYWGMRHLDDANESFDKVITLAESVLETIQNAPERLQWLHGVDESYRGKIRIMIEQKKLREALSTWEWYQSRPLLNSRNKREEEGGFHRTPSPQPLHVDSLPSVNGTRIVYAFFEDGVQIWVYRDGSLESEWVSEPIGNLRQEIREFQELCARLGKEEDLKQKAAFLYEVLLAPIAQYLPPSGTITVEADQMAYNLPWEALRNARTGYVGERYTFVYSPGFWMEQKLRSPASIDPRAKMTFLDAAGNLPGKDSEKKDIRALFVDARVVKSKADVLSALPQAEIFIFSGHGDRDGAGTDLLLDDGSVLKPADFSSVRLQKLQLAVLEACSSGIGNEFGMLDTANLVNPLLVAGTPSVIASRWNVDSAATSDLMKDFYHILGTGQSPAKALSAARLTFMKNSRYSHPYYWAGFRLIGRIQ